MSKGNPIRTAGRTASSAALAKQDARLLRRDAGGGAPRSTTIRSLGVLSDHRIVLDMNVARSARIFGEKPPMRRDGLHVARTIAWLFLKGLGVDPRTLEYKDFSIKGVRYYEAKLDLNGLGRPFDETAGHSAIFCDIEGSRLPLLFLYNALNPYSRHDLTRRPTMLELIPCHASSSRIANDAINHFLAFSGRDLHDGMDYISYTPYGNSN